MILYQLNPNLIITHYYNWKVTIKRVMQIHNIMVLIFITCAVINHLFVFQALVYVCYAFF